MALIRALCAWALTLGMICLCALVLIASAPAAENEAPLAKRIRAAQIPSVSRAVESCTRSLSLLTVNTFDPNRTIRPGGAGGWKAINLGANISWSGLSAKLDLYEAWLLNQSADRIAIFLDADILSGGCDARQMCQYYAEVVQASGGVPVIVSAEMGLYPRIDKKTKERYALMFPRMKGVLRALRVSTDVYRIAANPDCSAVDIGPCSDPPEYQYLNSGFMMGPAGKLLEAIRGMKLTQDSNDQWSATDFFLDHYNDVILDYAGFLCLSVHQLDLSVLRLSGSNASGDIASQRRFRAQSEDRQRAVLHTLQWLEQATHTCDGAHAQKIEGAAWMMERTLRR